MLEVLKKQHIVPSFIQIQINMTRFNKDDPKGDSLKCYKESSLGFQSGQVMA